MCIALGSVGLRLPFLAVPLITDEGGYAYVAQWLGRGLTLYRDLWFDRPQAIFLLYRLQFLVLGETAESIRLGAALYNAATTVLVFALGGELGGRRVGVTAALLFAAGSAAPALEGFTANGELYMALPVVAAVLSAVRRRWFWAGVLGGLACAVKPTAALSVGPALLVLLTWRPRSLRASLACAAGGLCGVTPFVADGLRIDPALYWYSVVGFRVSAHSAFSVGGALLADLMNTAPTALAAGGPLWLAGVAGALWTWRTRSGAAVSALLCGSVLGAAAGGYWYWHYYLGLVPGAALGAGLAVNRAFASGWATRRGRLAPLTGAAAAATALALFFNARVVGTSPDETSLRLYGRPAYVAAREIATYVRDRTSERETVYAAFAQADLYFLAERRSAARYLYWTEINRVPGALDELLEAVADAASRPAYVIGIDRNLELPGRAERFWELIKQHYVLEREIAGFPIFRAEER